MFLFFDFDPKHWKLTQKRFPDSISYTKIKKGPNYTTIHNKRCLYRCISPHISTFSKKLFLYNIVVLQKDSNYWF